jgi:hypothetical protein
VPDVRQSGKRGLRGRVAGHSTHTVSGHVTFALHADRLLGVLGRAQPAPEGDHGAIRAVVVRHRLAHREGEALVEADRADVAAGGDGT